MLEPKDTVDDEYGNISDDEFDHDQDRVKDEVYRRFSEEVRTQIEKLNARFDAIEQKIDITIDKRMFFDDLETSYKRISEKFKAIDEKYTRQEENTKQQKDRVSTQERSSRDKMRRRIVLIVLGLTVVTGSVIFYLVKMDQDKKPQPGEDFTQQDADNAQKLLEQWRSESDADFWKSIADCVDDTKLAPSLQSQMEMMAYVKNWTTASEITWGDTEKGDLIEELMNATSAGKPGDMFRKVSTLQHDGKPFERAVAADLCENALANLLAQNDAGGGT